MKIQKSIEINAPPEKIWSFMIDPEKILEWYIPLEKFEYTSEQRGGVDAPFYFEEKVPGGPMQLDCVITEWVENEALAFKMVSGNMVKSYGERWAVEGASSGSTFTFSMQGEYTSLIFRTLLAPIAQRTSVSTIEKMLSKLKSMVESG
jgi:uncharacterized protein YndB with AHSA1/START domain